MAVWAMCIPVFAIAEDPVEAIQLTYHNLQDLTADFTQHTTVEALGKTIGNQGTMALQKPGRLRMEYSGNPKRHYISDGKTLWIYTPGDNQYQNYPVGGQMVPREALTFLSGFGELQRTFAVEPYTPIRQEKDHTYLRLTPRRTRDFRQLECDFDARNLLVGLTIYNPSGNQTAYRFTNVQLNPGLAPGSFRFIPPAGTRAVHTPSP